MMNPKVDFYFTKHTRWQQEIELLRTGILACGLNEELKWGSPCYTFEAKNIVLIHVFKEYCAVLFFKGALLRDAKGILVQPTENVQAARQLRFTNVQEVVKQEKLLKTYVYEAIKIEKAGLKVPMKKTAAFEMPDEFAKRLKKDKALKKAFEALTPGRQRGYLLHFAQAKQSATREARIDKATPMIMEGKGLND